MTPARLAEIERLPSAQVPLVRELLDALKESEARVGKLREALIDCRRAFGDEYGGDSDALEALLTETAPDSREGSGT